MAQDLTASVLCLLQDFVEDVFANGGTPGIDLDPNLNQAITAGALMEENAAMMRPLYSPDGTCRGMNLYHIDGAWTSDVTDYAEGFAGSDCELTDGNEPVSVETEYNHNLFHAEFFSIDDGDCDNLFNDPSADGTGRVRRLFANRMALAMKNLRRKLNLSSIAFLAANATGVNRDGNLPSHITFDGGADEFQVNQEGFFQTPHSLTDIDAVVSNNDMFDYFLISGRHNFYNSRIDSDWFRLDDDKRNVSRWNTMIGSNFFDINLLDSTLTGKNTFAVMPGSYAFWNVGLFTTTPILVDTTNSIYQYSVVDPSLQISDNGVMRNVIYNVLYQKVCTGTDKNGRYIFTHRWKVHYLGGLAAAPPATDGHTGILHFTDVFVEGI